MDKQQFQIICHLMNQQLVTLQEIKSSLDQLILGNKESPNLTKTLEEFKTFDWSTIGAEVIRNDQFGAAIVNWKGLQFVRRSPSNKFGEAIWFSRCVGKDENNNNRYERLITFKPISNTEVDPIPEKVSRFFNK